MNPMNHATPAKCADCGRMISTYTTARTGKLAFRAHKVRYTTRKEQRTPPIPWCARSDRWVEDA